MSSLFQFPGAYVWTYKLPNHKEIKERVLPRIIEVAEHNADNEDYRWAVNDSTRVVTNYSLEKANPFEFFEPRDVEQIALGPAEEFACSGSLANALFPPKLAVSAFWWNRYKPGDTAPPHAHSGCISGVYLLEQNEPCPLRFLDINQHAVDPENPGLNYEPDAREGDILLFPGTLTHWVVPARSVRTTVSFNLMRREADM